ncbi:MAG: hypothetical protein IT440_14060 [Phycisphaeraceae bacterium]|nr:hypothetical protein [Phycisphaeraceae bacterium]
MVMLLMSAALAGKAPAVQAFAMPDATHVSAILRDDLTAAGIAYRDDADRKIDFHALRHTRGVWLATYAGATPREIQELMRVSTLGLVDRYCRSFRMTRTLITAGPDLDAPAKYIAIATGTDDLTVGACARGAVNTGH